MIKIEIDAKGRMSFLDQQYGDLFGNAFTNMPRLISEHIPGYRDFNHREYCKDLELILTIQNYIDAPAPKNVKIPKGAISQTDGLMMAPGFDVHQILLANFVINPFNISKLMPKTYTQLLNTFAHELIHSVQCYTNKFVGGKNVSLWEGKRLDHTNISYLDLPWEKEAHYYSRIISYEFITECSKNKDAKEFFDQLNKKQEELLRENSQEFSKIELTTPYTMRIMEI